MRLLNGLDEYMFADLNYNDLRVLYLEFCVKRRCMQYQSFYDRPQRTVHVILKMEIWMGALYLAFYTYKLGNA